MLMHGYAWVCMGMHGYAWVCMGMHVHTQTIVDRLSSLSQSLIMSLNHTYMGIGMRSGCE